MKKSLSWLVVMLLSISIIMTFSFAGCTEEAEEVEETAPAELVDVTWLSPRGTLEVMDDYDIWIAEEMGYFEELGINLIMEPGPMDAFATVKFVSEKKADMGYPSPGILTSSVDAGMDAIMVFEMMTENTFCFAVKEDSPIQSPEELAGKSISLGDAGWQVIVDPILVELGIDPASVTYINAGAQWGQAVSLGEADAALAWCGLSPQWEAVGLGLRFFYGEDFSEMPSNGYSVRKSDLSDPEKKDLYERFLKAVSMGFYFADSNPRAACQIVYDKFPAVREQMEPQLAFESWKEVNHIYSSSKRLYDKYGWADENGWNKYLDIIYELGQIETKLTFDDVVTNELIDEANNFDEEKVRKDAEEFELSDIFKNVKM